MGKLKMKAPNNTLADMAKAVQPIALDAPAIRSDYLDEPLLEFAQGKKHFDPKMGIAMYGPLSYRSSGRHPATIKVGLVGSAPAIEGAQRWLAQAALGLPGDEGDLGFPGFKDDRGFFSEISFDDDWSVKLNSDEIKTIDSIKNGRFRFEALLSSLDEKLQILSRKDSRPDIVVIAMPDEVYRRCRTTEYLTRDLGSVHRDLRRAIKSAAMKYRFPTQILRQQTFEDRTGDKPAKIAWNLFTGLYFKAGGIPWGPLGLSAGSCFMGVSFYRPPGSKSSMLHSSLVQAFDEHGNGLVLRGPEFKWNATEEGTNSPHLTGDDAHALVDVALRRYRQEMGQIPKRVVVHKTSRFWPEERDGFCSAISQYGATYDLLALSDQQSVRLLPVNKYPALRGTQFSVGDIDYLYTTGFVAKLGKFYGMHLPLPLQIADHVGYDTARTQLLQEVLVLTKMNWNSARLGGLYPITIRFARLVGDILREIPSDREPLSNFKFYM